MRRRWPRLLRPLLVLVLGWSAALPAEEVQVHLRIPSLEGEPGEEIPLELRVSSAEPLLVLTVELRIAPDAVDVLGLDAGGTAAANAPPQALLFDETTTLEGGKGWMAGVNLQPGPGPGTPVPAGAERRRHPPLLESVRREIPFLCPDAADADDDGSLTIADALAILRALFGGAPPLPPPGPAQAWFDPSPEDDLGCE